MFTIDRFPFPEKSVPLQNEIFLLYIVIERVTVGLVVDFLLAENFAAHVRPC
jgi:hypothetical protein